MSSIHDVRYQKLILNLIQIRESKDMTQVELSIILKKPQSYIAKVENLDRRLDVIELFDWLGALNSSLSQVLANTDLSM
jgi:transcriptional regulator with XRE-family HTH domain